ncbi:MAG: hypothetical protein AABW68_03950 [archaeon]
MPPNRPNHETVTLAVLRSIGAIFRKNNINESRKLVNDIPSARTIVDHLQENGIQVKIEEADAVRTNLLSVIRDARSIARMGYPDSVAGTVSAIAESIRNGKLPRNIRTGIAGTVNRIPTKETKTPKLSRRRGGTEYEEKVLENIQRFLSGTPIERRYGEFLTAINHATLVGEGLPKQYARRAYGAVLRIFKKNPALAERVKRVAHERRRIGAEKSRMGQQGQTPGFGFTESENGSYTLNPIPYTQLAREKRRKQWRSELAQLLRQPGIGGEEINTLLAAIDHSRNGVPPTTEIEREIAKIMEKPASRERIIGTIELRNAQRHRGKKPKGLGKSTPIPRYRRRSN